LKLHLIIGIHNGSSARNRMLEKAVRANDDRWRWLALCGGSHGPCPYLIGRKNSSFGFRFGQSWAVSLWLRVIRFRDDGRISPVLKKLD
jgi:hypothetical protein